MQFARLLAVTALPYPAAILLTGKRPTAGKFVTEVNIDGCIFKVYEANDFSLFLAFVTYFLKAHIPITWQAIWILRLASLCFAATLVMYGGQELVKL